MINRVSLRRPALGPGFSLILMVVLVLTALPTYGQACYLTADNGDEPDTLVQTLLDGSSPLAIGTIMNGATATTAVEATAWDRDTASLWAYDNNTFGKIDSLTGVFTPISTIGSCIRPGGAIETLNDIDALAYDRTQNRLWALERDEAGVEVLLQVDPVTGSALAGAFGPGATCIPVDLSGVAGNDLDAIAIDPADGTLYAISNTATQPINSDNQLVTIEPLTGVATLVADTTLGGELLTDIEGLSFDGKGNLYASTGRRSAPAGAANSLYRVDKVTGAAQLLANLESFGNDYETLECVAPDIQIIKTVRDGNVAAGTCPGVDLLVTDAGADVTYCFEVTNIGDTWLTDVTVDDPDLDITQADMTLLSGTLPLEPGATLVYAASVPATELVNTASTSGNPTDQSERDLPRFVDPTDDDPAEVTLTGVTVDPDIQLDKTVYGGHNAGAGCPGAELYVKEVPIGEEEVPIPITYCFVITNTGNTYLADITLDDPDLGTNVTDMTLSSGAEPLAPGDSIIYYYETLLTVDLINTAFTEGNPVFENGDDIPDQENPTDDDPAEVQKTPGEGTPGLYTIPTLNTWGLLLMLFLLGFFGIRRMRTA